MPVRDSHSREAAHTDNMSPLRRPLLLALVLVALAVRCQGSWYTRATAAPPSLIQEVPEAVNADGDVDPGTPLFLTPLIESGNVTGAQRAAQVKPFAGNVKSYAGFLTVNKVSGVCSGMGGAQMA